jgi:hypothetical protein
MDANDLIKGALPGAVAGCVLYLVGGLIGGAMGPGWKDILQGSAFFVGLVWALVGIRRKARAKKGGAS